jgi:hypothetical protein
MSPWTTHYDRRESKKPSAAASSRSSQRPGSACPGRSATNAPAAARRAVGARPPPVLHGPYHHWTRKLDGKTVGRYLYYHQNERYREWFDQAKRLRTLLNELEALSLRVAERVEGWDPQPPPPRHHPRGAPERSRSAAPRRSRTK